VFMTLTSEIPPATIQADKALMRYTKQYQNRRQVACPFGQGCSAPFQRHLASVLFLFQEIAMGKALIGRWHGPEESTVPKGWFQVPNAFVDDLKFADGSAVKVYMALLFRANQDKQSWLGLKRLTELTGQSRSTVIRSLRWLKCHHWIKARKRTGKSTVYTIWFAENHNKRCVTNDTGCTRETSSTNDTHIKIESKQEE
jgi:hypothetical protein